jgi:hypothetical protein
MPNSIGKGNAADVAQLIYQCGVSVDMNYSPSASGATVLTADDPKASAQIAFVKYFGYNPKTIQGVQRASYSEAAWILLLENELNEGRPLEYAGYDSTYGGHTWVCDGYETNGNSTTFDMNWGWGGYDDGFYAVDNLSADGYNFSSGDAALIGILPLTLYANNAGIQTIVSPAPPGVPGSGTSSCSDNVSPVISLTNFGDSTLKSCRISYSIDGGTPVNINWSGSLVSAQSVNVSLAPFSTSPGKHVIICYSSMPNGVQDSYFYNDTIKLTFYNNSIGSAVPIVEGFEESTALPSGWSVYSPGNDVAWQVVNNIAYSGSNCVGINNCSGDGSANMTNKTYFLYTTAYDFSASSTATIQFDVSYAEYSTKKKAYTDSLIVLYSVDCGSNWNRLYHKGGLDLETVSTLGTNNTCWYPTLPSEWRKETINSTALAGNKSVQFAFEDISDWGEWIYIDNINITGTPTGIMNYHANSGLSVYPNPTSINSVTVNGTNHNGNVHFILFDVAGREIKAGDIAVDGDGFKGTVFVNDLPSAMYFLKVYDEQNTWMNKLIVQ